MAFRTNTAEAREGGDFKLKPEGDYEVVIDNAEVATTRNGKENIRLVYVIRDDVNQKYQNGLIFHSIWKKSQGYQNDSDMSIGGFNYAQLMTVVKAARLPDGKEYATLDELLGELKGKLLRVHLFHDDFNDKYYEKVDRHMPTEYPQNKRSSRTAAPKPEAAPVAAESSNDDDYPF